MKKIKKQSGRNNAEQNPYALLHKKYGHTDPYEKGLHNMVRLVDAFFRFLSTRNSKEKDKMN